MPVKCLSVNFSVHLYLFSIFGKIAFIISKEKYIFCHCIDKLEVIKTTRGFHVRHFTLSPAARARISADMKARYRGPEGARLRAIDRANGRRARGSTWHR